MTVAELIAELSKLPQDMPVQGESLCCGCHELVHSVRTSAHADHVVLTSGNEWDAREADK